MIRERKPERFLYIDNPSAYNPSKFESNNNYNLLQKIQDVVHIVNGVVEKADGTFLYDFFFQELKNGKLSLRIIIGSCPQSETDVKKIKK